jgi:hypothetical protein
VVTGTITPNSRYAKWVSNLVEGAVAGKTTLDVTDTPNISEDEVKAVREDWAEFERRVIEQHPVQKASELLNKAYDCACLRDAKVYATAPVFGEVPVAAIYPFVLIDIASVGALTFGLYGTAKAAQPTKGAER